MRTPEADETRVETVTAAHAAAPSVPEKASLH